VCYNVVCCNVLQGVTVALVNESGRGGSKREKGKERKRQRGREGERKRGRREGERQIGRG